jgi:hypothetical protein
VNSMLRDYNTAQGYTSDGDGPSRAGQSTSARPRSGHEAEPSSALRKVTSGHCQANLQYTYQEPL